MKRLVFAAVLVALTASAGEARCKLLKGRLRHAVHRAVDAPFKVAEAKPVRAVLGIGTCVGGKCSR